jgi:hypothetical protein
MSSIPGRLTGCLDGRLTGCLDGRLTGCLDGRLTGRLIGRPLPDRRLVGRRAARRCRHGPR